MVQIKPMEIETQSFEIITKELQGRVFAPEIDPIVKRVIHTSADFDYADNLCFSEDGVALALKALKEGCDIVTDTQMAKAGINKTILQQLGGTVHCFISDEDVALQAKAQQTTRSAVSMQKAANLPKKCIFAIGNAPTALLQLDELIKQNKIDPVLIIGVPVGFVNVVESKEIIMNNQVPYIVAKGRKGGSNVAAAICNALLYQIKR